ncbi:aspartate-semialdehyde dehydrogenase [Buchnera aphidicola]|uniref:aspartate-semialdehyde dehydrogenase n=1 Tax=Buchnera aphidicola TaxID=9 RepID=UPI0030EC8F8C
MKKKLGFIGWRGIVGSILLKRMLKKKNFIDFKVFFYSTSQVNKKIKNFKGISNNILKDAYSLKSLKKLDIIITCQGSEYTQKIYYKLRAYGWKGYWIDAASDLRLSKDSLIVLDPINKKNIKKFIKSGGKTFVGGNCTVSLMLLALGGLFQEKLIKWMSVNTYQAASGGGAHYILELLKQTKYISEHSLNNLKNINSVLEIEKNIRKIVNFKDFPKKFCLAPLSMNLIPWIDSEIGNGQSKEEWKVQQESNKILNNKSRKSFIPIDGNCVRVDSLRCHSQSFLIKLKKNISIKDIEKILLNHNKWVKIIKNERISSINSLNPMAVSGTLKILIGRLRKLNIGEKYLSIFSIGDQLLWGAAEPLRRILNYLK